MASTFMGLCLIALLVGGFLVFKRALPKRFKRRY